MRVLLVNKFHYPHGGADRHYLALGGLLSARGHQVFYAAQKPPSSQSRALPPLSVEFPFVDFSSVTLGGFFAAFVSPWRAASRAALRNYARVALFAFYNPLARRRLRAFLRSQKIDVVHVHNLYHHVSASVLPVFAEFGIPVVQTVHDYHHSGPAYAGIAKGISFPSPWQVVSRRLVQDSFFFSVFATLSFLWERRYYRSVKKFVVPSRACADAMFRYVPKEKIVVLRHYVDFVPLPRLPERSVVWIGRDDIQKGTGLLSRLAAVLPDGWRLDAYGISEAKESAAGRLRCRGAVPRGEIVAALSRAAFQIVPTSYPETFSYVVAESIVAGCPAVVSDTPAIRELMEAPSGAASPFGTVVSASGPDNAAAWESAVARAAALFESGTLAFDEGRAATLRSSLGSDAYARALEELYSSVCAS